MSQSIYYKNHKENINKFNIYELSQKIPNHCFVKSPIIGTYYILRDFLLWYSTYYVFEYYTNHSTPYMLLYWTFSGFWIWCQFMNGHDCGHGSFSNSYVLNNIMGHLTHTPLLTPFNTWAESHRRHHIGHNHINNDYSHDWISYDNRENKSIVTKIFQYTGIIQLIGWFSYMAGGVDGGHWLPFGGRLWNENYSVSKFRHSVFSSSLVFLQFYYILKLCNFDLSTFIVYYGVPWIIFSSWLVTVTYLQHHDDTIEETVIYGDESWTYVAGALQTVDRSYGPIIDNLTHNITNCHIIHHVFYTKIPHYHLEEATTHLYKYLDEKGIMYKYRYTPNFFYTAYKSIFLHFKEGVLVN